MAHQPQEDTPYVRYIKGGQAQLTKLFEQNELVALDFFATWCPPCIQLKPILIRETDASKNFILGVIDVDKQTNTALSTKGFWNTCCVPMPQIPGQHCVQICRQQPGQNERDDQSDFYDVRQSANSTETQVKATKFKCFAGHDLVLTAVLPPPYPDNSFQCDLCKGVDVSSEKRKMMHCQPCNFDVCHTCCHE